MPTRLTNLPAATALDADDEFYVVEDGNSRKCTIPQMMAVSALGWGQTWQNVIGSRAVSTSYQNTTGRPIMVSVRYEASSGSVDFQVSANGSSWVTVSDSPSTAFSTNTSIVPNGHFYRVNGAATVSVWAELR